MSGQQKRTLGDIIAEKQKSGKRIEMNEVSSSSFLFQLKVISIHVSLICTNKSVRFSRVTEVEKFRKLSKFSRI